MMLDVLGESLRHRAIEVLRHCSHEFGIKGSGGSHGHHQVWARDSMIALLGGALVKDEVIGRSLRTSVKTLRQHQQPSGSIPNHVDAATGKPNFRAYSDGGLWYVIGSTILEPDYRSIYRVLRWYECQDVDRTGLISIQEASDWEDLFCTRGKGLYVNCLYVIALRRAAAFAEQQGKQKQAELYRNRAEAVGTAINQILWYSGDGKLLRQVAHSFSTDNLEFDSLGRRRWLPQKRELVDASYYVPYVGFREVGEWFDSLGNLLAILAGVADDSQTARIFHLIETYHLAAYPIKAIYPPVERGTSDWRDYYAALNLPNQYHNGGIWPFIGGFYVAALVKTGRYADAETALNALTELNRDSDFCEWLHGETREPLGVREQAWSAGMYLYAAECVARRETPFF